MHSYFMLSHAVFCSINDIKLCANYLSIIIIRLIYCMNQSNCIFFINIIEQIINTISKLSPGWHGNYKTNEFISAPFCNSCSWNYEMKNGFELQSFQLMENFLIIWISKRYSQNTNFFFLYFLLLLSILFFLNLVCLRVYSYKQYFPPPPHILLTSRSNAVFSTKVKW